MTSVCMNFVKNDVLRVLPGGVFQGRGRYDAKPLKENFIRRFAIKIKFIFFRRFFFSAHFFFGGGEW